MAQPNVLLSRYVLFSSASNRAACALARGWNLLRLIGLSGHGSGTLGNWVEDKVDSCSAGVCAADLCNCWYKAVSLNFCT